MTQCNATNLTIGVGRATSSFSPLAISPDGHQIMFFSVYSAVTSGTPNVPTVSLAGWTFAEVTSVVFGAFSGTDHRLTLFIGIGPTGSGLTPGIDFSGQNQLICEWVIDQVSNTLVTGTGGINAILQTGTFGPHGSGFSITFGGAFANINNATYAVTAKDAVNTIVPTAPMVELNQIENSGSPNGGLGSQFSSGNVPVPAATFTGSGGDDVGAIACELIFLSLIQGFIV